MRCEKGGCDEPAYDLEPFCLEHMPDPPERPDEYGYWDDPDRWEFPDLDEHSPLL